MRFWKASTRDWRVDAGTEMPTRRRLPTNYACVLNNELCLNIQTMTCDGSDEEGGA
jgi:hypothetical protein